MFSHRLEGKGEAFEGKAESRNKVIDPSAVKHTDKWVNGTGDIVTGDVIRFSEAVFSGSYKSPKYAGDRVIEARVINDSYGKDKQQHTFSLEVISSTGEEALAPGIKTTRKGRNVYKNGTERLAWKDETQRKAAADEKHSRGNQARAQRDVRKAENNRYKLVEEAVNQKFNEELNQFDNNELPQRHIFNLGKPGDILQQAGFPDASIEMLIGTLKDKIKNHTIKTELLRDLPISINDPIFVAKSKSKDKSLVVRS